MQELFQLQLISEKLSNSSQSQSNSIFAQWHREESTNVLAVAFSHRSTASQSQTSTKTLLKLLSKNGKVIHDTVLDGLCISMDWSAADLLALALDSGKIFILDISNMQESVVETGWKGSLILKWSTQSQLLAIGSSKGNLLIYNPAISKKIPIIGKASKAITALEWTIDSRGESIVLVGSEDKTVSSYSGFFRFHFQMTINKETGDLIKSLSFENEVTLIKSYDRITDEDGIEKVIACAVGGKSIKIIYLESDREPVEFVMNSKYSAITTLEWFDDDKLLVAFANGYVIGISTYYTPGKEVFHIKESKEKIRSVSLCRYSKKFAVLTDSKVFLRDLFDPKEVASIVTFDNDRNSLDAVQWSADGSVVSISFKSGMVHAFLERIPLIAHSTDRVIAFLSALNQVTVVNTKNQSIENFDATTLKFDQQCKVALDFEPKMIQVGHGHLAVANEKKLHFYSIAPDFSGCSLLWEYSPEHFISGLCLDQYCVTMILDGKLVSRGQDSNDTGKWPTDTRRIRDLCGAKEFVIGANDLDIWHLLSAEKLVASHFHSSRPIRKVFPDHDGVRVAVVDDSGYCSILNPVTDSFDSILPLKGGIQNVLWNDRSRPDRPSLALFDSQRLYVVVLFEKVLEGPNWALVAEVDLGNVGYHPLIFSEQDIVCLTHQQIAVGFKLNIGAKNDCSLDSLLGMLYFGSMQDLWPLLSNPAITIEIWNILARTALNILDLGAARRICTEKRFFTNSVALFQIRDEEDLNMLCGHLCVLLKKYDLAQQYFLKSERPIEALIMRKDLGQIDIALKLSELYAPEERHELMVLNAELHAQQSKHAVAVEMFQKVMEETKESILQQKCLHGIVCSFLSLGDISKGMRLLVKIDDREVLTQCASILTEHKQYHEAAMIFEKAGKLNQAAEYYAKIKNFKKVEEYLEYTESPQTLSSYAKYQESLGNFEQAIEAFKKAEDYENCCRVYVDKLQQINRAVELVRSSRSKEAARVVLKFFQASQDYKSIVEFCVIAGLDEEALHYAQTYGFVDVYAESLDDEEKDKLLEMAQYFEQRDDFYNASKFMMRSGQYDKAMDLILKVPKKQESIALAVEIVKLSNKEALASRLKAHIEFDSQYSRHLIPVSLAMNKRTEAVNIALRTSQKEQEQGNYKQARDILKELISEFQSRTFPVTIRLYEQFVILHSYLLVKLLVKMEEHEAASRMLLRVFKSIQNFELHIVPILTSTVIECQRAGLKKSAFEAAAMLCRPEYRSQIDEKFRRKIELAVRRPENEEKEESCSPCPYCEASIPSSNMTCGECMKALPICAASGMHMTLENWSQCPKCNTPVLADSFKVVLEKYGTCPMCDSEISVPSIRNLSRDDVQRQLVQFFEMQNAE